MNRPPSSVVIVRNNGDDYISIPKYRRLAVCFNFDGRKTVGSAIYQNLTIIIDVTFMLGLCFLLVRVLLVLHNSDLSQAT